MLEKHFPHWREATIHESSPSGAPLQRFREQCPGYVPTQYFPDIDPGVVHLDFRCEDLARQTFEDGTFDLVITQDVMEHLLEPDRALQEISRTLRVGGAHVFTVPWYYWKPTKVRARLGANGIEHLADPEYHINPVDDAGALVVTEWGRDLCESIFDSCGMMTTVHSLRDRRLGIDAEFTEVFVSRKSSDGASRDGTGR